MSISGSVDGSVGYMLIGDRMFFPPDATTEEESVAADEKGSTTEEDSATEELRTTNEAERGNDASASKASKELEGAETAPPQLPDVPTHQPKEDGQPDAKKQKLDSVSTEKEEGEQK